MNNAKNIPNLNIKEFKSLGNGFDQSDIIITTEPDKIKKDDINIMYKEIIQILISELGFLIIFGLVILIIYIIPEKHSKKIFYSKKKKFSNKSQLF